MTGGRLSALSRSIVDKRAIVTGAASGMGRATAHLFADEGARVVVADVDQTGLMVVVDEIRAIYGDDAALGVVCDVSSGDELAGLVDATIEWAGGIDILVNNAGLTRDNILLRLKDDDWDAVIDANLRGAFATIRAATRGMMKRRWGRIINISSVVGLTGNKGQANYAASKAGLIGLTKSVAKEFASRNILANVIAPGFIETDMTAGMTPEARAAMSGQIPLERLGSPQDIANAVAFLASEQAAYITGQVLVIDGGLVM
jgi:3-oxoacyl-[acyl-carrier protein] reductase